MVMARPSSPVVDHRSGEDIRRLAAAKTDEDRETLRKEHAEVFAALIARRGNYNLDLSDSLDDAHAREKRLADASSYRGCTEPAEGTNRRTTP
jgi:hypothetical protein